MRHMPRAALWSTRFSLAIWSLVASIALPALAEGPVDEDDREFALEHQWIYNDLDRGLELARRTGKPLFVVIRCPP